MDQSTVTAAVSQVAAHATEQAAQGGPSPDTQTGAQIIAEIIQGGESYVLGTPIKVVIDIPAESLPVTFKNPFGHVYNGTLSEKNGKVVFEAK